MSVLFSDLVKNRWKEINTQAVIRGNMVYMPCVMFTIVYMAHMTRVNRGPLAPLIIYLQW